MIFFFFAQKYVSRYHGNGNVKQAFRHHINYFFLRQNKQSKKVSPRSLTMREQPSSWLQRWLSGRVSDSGARGPGFETYRRRVVSLSKTLYSPKVLVNYPGSDGSVPT